MEVIENKSFKNRFAEIRKIYNQNKKDSRSDKKLVQNSYSSKKESNCYFFLKDIAPLSLKKTTVFPCDKKSLLYLSSRQMQSNLLIPLQSNYNSDRLKEVIAKLSDVENNIITTKTNEENIEKINHFLQNKENGKERNKKIELSRKKNIFTFSSEEILNEKFTFEKLYNQFIKYPFKFKPE